MKWSSNPNFKIAGILLFNLSMRSNYSIIKIFLKLLLLLMMIGRDPVDNWYAEIKDHVFGKEPTSLKSGMYSIALICALILQSKY